MNIRLILWLIAAAVPITAGACIEGVPASFEVFPPPHAQIVRSSWSQEAGDVRVLDAAARQLRGAQVAFVLPDSLDATLVSGPQIFAGYDPTAVVAQRINLARIRALAIDRLRAHLGWVWDGNGPHERGWEILRQPF